MRRAFLLTGLALATIAPGAGAQSIFASGGLGVPVSPVDARVQALGGIGVGLFGANPSLINPAEIAGSPFRGITTAVQSSSRSIDFGGQNARSGSNRFPLIRVIYPLGPRLVTSVGYGAFLDESWAVETSGVELIGADSVEVRDLIESDGGLAQLQLGAAYAVTPSLAVGLGGGLYTGGLERRITRDFLGSAPGGINAFRRNVEWTERAPFVSAGFRWDPASILRVGASVTWAGSLEAETDDEDARDFQIDLPLQVSAGASAVLAPQLLGTVAARWAGWSRAADGFDPAVAPGDTWEVGTGVEWSGAALGDRGIPIRLGYRYTQFPFRYGGQTPTEWAATLGLGLQLARTDFGPLAVLDAALDRGGRSAGGADLAEDFWRLTLSVAVFGR